MPTIAFGLNDQFPGFLYLLHSGQYLPSRLFQMKTEKNILYPNKILIIKHWQQICRAYADDALAVVLVVTQNQSIIKLKASPKGSTTCVSLTIHCIYTSVTHYDFGKFLW